MLLHRVNVTFVSSVVSAVAFCFVISVRYNAMSLEHILCVAMGCGIFVYFDNAELFKLILVSLKVSCHSINDILGRRKIVIVCGLHQYCYI